MMPLPFHVPSPRPLATRPVMPLYAEPFQLPTEPAAVTISLLSFRSILPLPEVLTLPVLITRLWAAADNSTVPPAAVTDDDDVNELPRTSLPPETVVGPL